MTLVGTASEIDIMQNPNQFVSLLSGLDPTILFYMGNNRSRDLDATDALFVDILHTGAGILGQWGPNGHADFYVNGGSSQPGCAHDTIFRKWFFTIVYNSRGFFW